MMFIDEDSFKDELQKRVEAIDSGEEVVTPYMDGMEVMLQRLKEKHSVIPYRVNIKKNQIEILGIFSANEWEM